MSLSSSWPSAARSPSRATSAANGSKSARNGWWSYSARQKAFTRSSCAVSGSIQLVVRFASRSAFSRYASIRSTSIGHAPTSVWKMKYRSTWSGPSIAEHASSQRLTCAAHSSGIPASAPIRARTSPERLVSWVWVTSRLCGKRRARSRFPAWKASTGMPNRDGSPPTSLSASRRP